MKFVKALMFVAILSLLHFSTAYGQNRNNGQLMQWDDVGAQAAPPNAGATMGNNNLNSPMGGGGYNGASGGGQLTTSQSSSSFSWFCWLFPQYCGGNDVPLDGGMSLVAVAGAGIAVRRVIIKKKKKA